MKKEFNTAVISKLIIIALSLTILFIVNQLFGNAISRVGDALKYILIPAAIALFISYLMAPIETRIYNKTKNKIKSTIITMVLFLIILSGILALVVFLIWSQVGDIVNLVQNNYDKIMKIVNGVAPNLTDDVNSWIKANINFGTLTQIGPKILSGLKDTMMYLIMIPFYLFFILYDKNKIVKGIGMIAPKKYHYHIEQIWLRADTSIVGYFRGRIISMLLLGAMLFLTLPIFFALTGSMGIWSAILYGLIFSVLFAIMDIIPYIGPIITAAILMIFSALLGNNINQIIWFPIIAVAINVVVQTIQSEILIPRIMGKEVNIHPLLVFASIMFFGYLFPFMGVGAIIAIPIVGAAKSTIGYILEIKKNKG